MKICRIVVTMFVATLIIPAAMADFTGRLNLKGELSLDDGKFSLISGDILYVKDTGGRCKYLIPESEIPQFATLLQPLNKPTERKKNFLDIENNCEDGINRITCEGEKINVLEFKKNILFSERHFSVKVDYSLDNNSLTFVYALKIPTGNFDNAIIKFNINDKNSREETFSKVFDKKSYADKIISVKFKIGNEEFLIKEKNGKTFTISKGGNVKEQALYYYFKWSSGKISDSLEIDIIPIK